MYICIFLSGMPHSLQIESGLKLIVTTGFSQINNTISFIEVNHSMSIFIY